MSSCSSFLDDVEVSEPRNARHGGIEEAMLELVHLAAVLSRRKTLPFTSHCSCRWAFRIIVLVWHHFSSLQKTLDHTGAAPVFPRSFSTASSPALDHFLRIQLVSDEQAQCVARCLIVHIGNFQRCTILTSIRIFRRKSCSNMKPEDQQRSTRFFIYYAGQVSASDLAFLSELGSRLVATIVEHQRFETWFSIEFNIATKWHGVLASMLIWSLLTGSVLWDHCCSVDHTILRYVPCWNQGTIT